MARCFLNDKYFVISEIFSSTRKYYSFLTNKQSYFKGIIFLRKVSKSAFVCLKEKIIIRTKSCLKRSSIKTWNTPRNLANSEFINPNIDLTRTAFPNEVHSIPPTFYPALLLYHSTSLIYLIKYSSCLPPTSLY